MEFRNADEDLKVNLRDRLYYNLPDLYLREDPKYGYALQKVLSVLGVGFNELEAYIRDLTYAYDLDKCPAKFLPLIAQFYGVEFPYSFDEATQRKFLKVIPKLYEYKGTDKAFKYLAREIFGQATVTEAWTPTKDPSMSFEDWKNSEEWKKLFVSAEVDGETYRLDDKANQFIKFSEILRPVNTILIPRIKFFYRDSYTDNHSLAHTFDFDWVNCDDATESAIKKRLDDLDTYKLKELLIESYASRHTLYDTDPFYLNKSLLNSPDTLSTWNDLDRLIILPEQEIVTNIKYDTHKVDIINDVSCETIPLSTEGVGIDNIEYIDSESVILAKDDNTALDEIALVDKETFSLSKLNYVDIARPKIIDTDSVNKANFNDTTDRFKVAGTRKSHLGFAKLVTSFRTTDFISQFS